MTRQTLSELEQAFWDKVNDMHLEERISVLNDRRDELIENMAYGTPSQRSEHAAAIGRLNTEIKRVNRLLHNSAWSLAVLNLLGADIHQQVRIEVERLEGFIYRGKSYEQMLADRERVRQEEIAKNKGKP